MQYAGSISKTIRLIEKIFFHLNKVNRRNKWYSKQIRLVSHCNVCGRFNDWFLQISTFLASYYNDPVPSLRTPNGRSCRIFEESNGRDVIRVDILNISLILKIIEYNQRLLYVHC